MTDQSVSINHDVLGVIPARMASIRFPGKPVVLVGGVPMVIRVYRQVQQALSQVVIATCDTEITEVAKQYGAGVILTRKDHPNGTSRCMEAAELYKHQTGRTFRAIVNIQGDEPLISPAAIALLSRQILKPDAEIATLVRTERNISKIANPNRVKVVTDQNGFALYFSRSPIPYDSNRETAEQPWLCHTGIYAFKPDMLDKLVRLTPTPLEVAESLEQLRWLEHGFRILCCETDYEGFGIDTPEDLKELERSGKL
ncbi:MAG: 3-deoxy-manno-octulosonate cytidylyltransferase [Bacteroidota bacterium]